MKAPEYLSDEEASTLPIAAVTAWMSINGMRPMGQSGGEGEIVLLQGTGGVAIAGLQIAKASGAKGVLIFFFSLFFFLFCFEKSFLRNNSNKKTTEGGK